MKCLETRKRLGAKFRRYRPDDGGNDVETYEISVDLLLDPVALLNFAEMVRIQSMTQKRRTTEIPAEMKSRIENLLKSGKKVDVIVLMTAVSKATVMRIRAKLDLKKQRPTTAIQDKTMEKIEGLLKNGERIENIALLAAVSTSTVRRIRSKLGLMKRPQNSSSQGLRAASAPPAPSTDRSAHL